MNSIQSIRKKLLDAGVKPSLQRIEILRYLCGSYDHPSVDRIYEDLHPQMPTLSRTTVYNTVRMLCHAGLICSLSIEHTNQRFDAHMHLHDHFICNACGRIFDIPASQQETTPSMEGMTVFRKEVSYFGICRECNRKRQGREQ